MDCIWNRVLPHLWGRLSKGHVPDCQVRGPDCQGVDLARVVSRNYSYRDKRLGLDPSSGVLWNSQFTVEVKYRSPWRWYTGHRGGDIWVTLKWWYRGWVIGPFLWSQVELQTHPEVKPTITRRWNQPGVLWNSQVTQRWHQPSPRGETNLEFCGTPKWAVLRSFVELLSHLVVMSRVKVSSAKCKH